VKKLLAFGCLAVGLIPLAGCGSSSSTTSSSAASSAPAATTTANTSSTTTATPAAASGETIATKHSKLGTILAAGPKHLTVYLFEADKGGQSACSGDCAQDWPPVTTDAEAQASGAAVSADLGTITRSDGTKQVTYKGHPLYFFIKDKDDGDAYGQGSKAFGAGWYVLKPNGSKVDDDDDSHDGGSDDDAS
jgi:predicted lipoprotein with Yx(FWY)xxD motif